jgi:hypothetical protein
MSSLLAEYVSLVFEGARPKKRLTVFDFDDTLVRTKSMVYVHHASGDSSALTPGEFAIYEEKPGDKFDFEDFSRLVDPEEIKWTVRILRNLAAKGSEVVILTARSSQAPAQQFLREAQLPPYEVVALGSSNPLRKSDYIASRIESDRPDIVEFFDDSPKNIAAVESLIPRYPETKIILRHVKH